MTDIRALVVVDVQNDFVEGGSLAVTGGLDVAYATDLLLASNAHPFDYVVTTQDWHEPMSTNGGHFGDPPDFVDTWPVHCLAATHGADIVYKTTEDAADARFFKGFGKPAYSGFEAWTNEPDVDNVDLGAWLRIHGVTRVAVIGLAGDYCVRATAVDAVKQGFETFVVPEFVASIGGEAVTRDVVREIRDMQ